MLAFWLGGACGYPFVPIPVPPEVLPEVLPPSLEGIGAGRRYPIDDEEILEVLKIWTVWQDIE